MEFAQSMPGVAMVTAGAVLVGLAARLLLYVQNVSLWLDELFLALNIATRSYLHLSILKFDQATAPLYLWLERLCVDVFGVSEASLRLPSLVAGAVVLVTVALLAVKAGFPYAAPLATAITALSANLCLYSNQLKPYEIDAAVSAVLVLFAMPVLTENGSRGQHILLLIAGVTSVFLSIPSIFILAGVGIAWVIHEGLQGFRCSRLLWLGATLLVWVGSFSVAYALFYAPAARSEYMQHFWSGAGISASSGLVKVAGAIDNAFTTPALGLDEYSVPIGIEGGTLLVLGCWAVFRNCGLPVMTACCGPLVFSVMGALLGKWMLAVRLMLFATPAVCLLIGLGVCQVCQWVPRPMRLRVFWIASAFLLILPLKYTIWNMRHAEGEANRSLVDTCLGQAQPGDVLYLYPRATPAWAFYSTDWRSDGQSEIAEEIAAIERSGPNAGNSASRHARVVHEGFSWRIERLGRVELFGVPTGIQNTALGMASPAPDPGWAENEIDRMLKEHSARIWLVFSHYQQPAFDTLLHRLTERGFQPKLVYVGQKVVLGRIVRDRLASNPNNPN